VWLPAAVVLNTLILIPSGVPIPGKDAFISELVTLLIFYNISTLKFVVPINSISKLFGETV
jgi:hypothetical protein